MSNMVGISAELRTRVGKGAARTIRRQNRIPAVIYGDSATAQAISVDARELNMLVSRSGFSTSICSVNLSGQVIRTIVRDIHFDPVRDFVTHVDFFRLGNNARINISVPVHFLNEQSSPGIKRGGILNVVSHEIALDCQADCIPDHLEVDLTGLEIGHSVHVASLKLPDGVRLVSDDKNITIATIVVPSAAGSEASTPSSAAATAPGAAQTKAAPQAKAEVKKKPKS